MYIKVESTVKEEKRKKEKKLKQEKCLPADFFNVSHVEFMVNLIFIWSG